MKKLYFILLMIPLLSSCSKYSTPIQHHMSFMGTEIAGTQPKFLCHIKSGFRTDSIFDNLELQLDSVSDKSFICSQNGNGNYESNIWFEFFFFTEPYCNEVVGLQGWSIINQQVYDVLRICLIENLGVPSYNKKSLTPSIMYELDIHEALVYNDLESEYFEIWKTELGYIILQYDLTDENNIYHVELDIIDKNNFNKYIDKQIEQQKN